MNHLLGPLVFVIAAYAAMLFLNERYSLFRCDAFSSQWMKLAAYIWLGVFMLLICVVVVLSSLRPPTAQELARVPFYSLFSLHAILLIFLAGWWLMTRRPPLREFLSIQTERPGTALLVGLAVGVGGWAVTLGLALMIAAILQAAGALPENTQPPAMIAWMARLPLWKKALIVLSAMTVEEAFFRGWLQKRVGLIASTILFALAHVGLGQPFLLIGVAIISFIIGFTFYRTKDLLPGIVAHGVFDAVQLFVVIPIAFRVTGMG